MLTLSNYDPPFTIRLERCALSFNGGKDCEWFLTTKSSEGSVPLEPADMSPDDATL